MALAGCAGTQSARSPEVPLDMHRLKRPDAPSGLPLVRARIKQREIWMVVDLGAGATTIDQRLIAELDLATDGAVVAAGVGQSTMAAHRVTGVELTVGALGTFAPSVYAIAFPEALSARQIEGILSPQHLVSNGEGIVLDLRRGRLWRGPAPANAAPVGAACASASGEDRHYYSAVTVAGETFTALIDTGATRGSLTLTPARQARFSDASNGHAEVSGAAGAARLEQVGPLAVRWGALETRARFHLEPPSPNSGCASEGSLGMDVLHRCVVHIDNARFSADCGP